MSVENLIKSFCRTIHKFCLKPSRSKQTERRQTKKSDNTNKDLLFVHFRLAQTDLMADGSLYTAEGNWSLFCHFLTKWNVLSGPYLFSN